MMLTKELWPPPLEPDAAMVQEGPADMRDLERRLAPDFERSEPRQRAMASLRGLLSPAERQTSWQLAKVRGDATPDAFQHLVRRALGDPEAVRDALRHSMIQPLEDAEAVLVIDEPGFRNKGRHSAGVARQDSGTAGRRETWQRGGVGSARRLGHALLARARYRPTDWADDPARCRQAGIPEARRLATTPPLAQQRRPRTLAAGVPARWGTGASVYGDNRRLRMWRAGQPHASVLAVSGQEQVWLGWRPRRINTLLAGLPIDGWTRLSAGAGAKGPRSGAAGCWCGGV